MNEKGPGGADRLGQGQTKAGGPRPLAAQTCAYLFLQWSLKKNNCKHLEIRDSLSFFCLSVCLPPHPQQHNTESRYRSTEGSEDWAILGSHQLGLKATGLCGAGVPQPTLAVLHTAHKALHLASLTLKC